MTDVTTTPSGAISEHCVENAIIALRARLRETPPGSLMTRPLQRSQVLDLLRIVTAYRAITRPKEGQP